MALTKLEKMSWEDLNKLSKSELKKVVASGIKASYDRMDKLKKAGYEESDYNRVFKNYMGKGVKTALKKLDRMNLNQLRDRAGFVKTHLNSNESSLAGKARQDIATLNLLHRLMTGSDDKKASIKRVRENKESGYRMKGRFYSRKELSEFWKIIRRVDENNALQVLKGGSDEGVREVHNLVFDKGLKDPTEILEELGRLKAKYEEEDARKAEEAERRLEEIRAKKGRSFTAR